MNKIELKKIIKLDKKNYKTGDWIKDVFFLVTNHLNIRILKTLLVFRKCNYYRDRKGILNKLLFLYFTSRKNKLSSIYNLELSDHLGSNIKIYHLGIILNKNVVVGDNVRFHGNNCVGNKDGSNKSIPRIGNNVDIGFGAVIIGNIEIADNIIIGANSVVNKSFLEPNIIIAGNPARKINKNQIVTIC